MDVEKEVGTGLDGLRVGVGVEAAVEADAEVYLDVKVEVSKLDEE